MVVTIKKATNADTEDIFNTFAVTNQLAINTRNKIGLINKITPIYVATPFPPLNFSHIGKICPK